MPRVPTLDEFSANVAVTQPVAPVQAAVANVPNFGPQQGAEMGRALMQAGSALSQIVVQEQNDINEAATREADNAAAQSISKLMNDPEGGYLTLRGKSAVERRAAVRNGVQSILNSSGEGLNNDMQRRMYSAVAQRRMQMALQQIDTHSAEQTRVWNESETTARAANAADNAVSNWYAWNQPAGPTNPFTTARDTMVAETRALAQLKGFGPDSDVAKAAVTAQLTRMHQGVISSMVAGDKVTEASEYFKRNYNEIDPSQRPTLEANLRKAEGAVIASKTADTIWGAFGPVNRGDAIDLFKMETRARELFPNEPERAKATIDELRQRATAWDKSEGEFITANVNAVGQLLVSGKSAREILLSPAFLALPGAKQKEVSDALQQEANKANLDLIGQLQLSGASAATIRASAAFQALPGAMQQQVMTNIEDRAYTMQQRGFAAEDRAYTLGQRARTARLQAEDDRDRAVAPLVLRYSDPRNLQNMSRQDVEALWTKIGVANTRSLLASWDSLQNKAEGATIISTKDLIDGSAAKLGIVPATGKMNNDQALAMINYQRFVAEKVAAFEASELQGRRKASPEEVRRILQGVEMDMVYVNRFGPDRQVAVAALNPQQMVDAYVKVGNEEIQLSQISTTQRALIIQALRSAGMAVTEQNIATYWVRGGKKR